MQHIGTPYQNAAQQDRREQSTETAGSLRHSSASVKIMTSQFKTKLEMEEENVTFQGDDAP